MYSLEERMSAVRLYIKSGCSEGAVIRELGYPSPVSLRNWYKEYLRSGELHASTPRSLIIRSKKKLLQFPISKLTKQH